MKTIRKISVALIVIGIVIAPIIACNKEKKAECQDCDTPSLLEINKFSDFASTCHNSTLDIVLPTVKQSWQKGETLEPDSIIALITEHCKNEYANYCSVQVSDEMSSKMVNIENACKNIVINFVDSIISNDQYLITFLDTQTSLSTFEKNTVLQIYNICSDSIYENRCNRLALLKQELIDMGCESEVLHNMVSIAQGSNDYWEEHLTEYFPGKFPFRKLGLNLLLADSLSGLASAIIAGFVTCTGTLVFGPGGVVTCVGGTFVWGAISGSAIELGYELYEYYSKQYKQ